HPPYVGTREIRYLPDEIQKFEPRVALTDGSPLGDRILGRVAEEAPEWLRPDGWLLVEVSPDRSRDVATTLRRAGLRDVRRTAGGLGGRVDESSDQPRARDAVGLRPGAGDPLQRPAYPGVRAAGPPVRRGDPGRHRGDLDLPGRGDAEGQLHDRTAVLAVDGG